MSSKNSKIIYLLSVIISLLYLGCAEESIPILPNDPEYVPGQVIVKFNESVNDSFFYAFIGSIDLQIHSRNYDSYWFWVETPKDSDLYYQSNFSQNWPLFTGVSVSEYPYEDIDTTKGYIFLGYKSGNDASDISEGKNYIESLGLTLKRVNIIPITNIRAVLLVPIGEELNWKNQLSQYSFIEYADLNYINRTHI